MSTMSTTYNEHIFMNYVAHCRRDPVCMNLTIALPSVTFFGIYSHVISEKEFVTRL